MSNLRMLNTGEISKKDFLNRHKAERFELYDLGKDPYEESPMMDGIDPASLSSCRTKIIELSTPAVQSEQIFAPVDKNVIEKIARQLFLEEMEETLNVLIENKNLFNKLIERFLKRNKDVPDKEFIMKCYSIFLNRGPRGKELDRLMRLMQEGVPRDTVFMTKIFQLVEFRTRQIHEETNVKIVEKLYEEAKQQENVEKVDLTEQLQAELNHKKRIIDRLIPELTQVKATLNTVYNSRTWKLGQLYGWIFRAEAKLRKNFSKLLGKR